MANQNGNEQSPTPEEIAQIIPDERNRELLLRLMGHLESDQAAIVLLKGHLLIEEVLTAAIENFLFHPKYLEGARLTFAQKLAVARSMSLDEHSNSMWELVAKVNKLRNTLSHSLNGTERASAMDALKQAYFAQGVGNLSFWEQSDEAGLLTGVIAMCLGFVGAFHREIERFRGYVDTLDKVINPHRHANRLP